MADITSGITILEQVNPGGLREIVVITADTADASDTYTITLEDHGMANFQSFYESVHTTAGSVIVQGASTTVVSAGVLTVTLGTGANQRRVATIGGN